MEQGSSWEAVIQLISMNMGVSSYATIARSHLVYGWAVILCGDC